MKTYVFDAGALLAHAFGESGAEIVERLMFAAGRDAPVLMSAVNWGEVYYTLGRVQGEGRARAALGRYRGFPIRVMEADGEVAIAAAELRLRSRLPYGDCFAATLARQKSATLVAKDSDFKAVEREIEILWLK